MDEGKVIGSGPHQTLLQTCPLYTRLYRAQATGGAPGEIPSSPVFETPVADDVAQDADVIPFPSATESEDLDQGRRRNTAH